MKAHFLHFCIKHTPNESITAHTLKKSRPLCFNCRSEDKKMVIVLRKCESYRVIYIEHALLFIASKFRIFLSFKFYFFDAQVSPNQFHYRILALKKNFYSTASFDFQDKMIIFFLLRLIQLYKDSPFMIRSPNFGYNTIIQLYKLYFSSKKNLFIYFSFEKYLFVKASKYIDEKTRALAFHRQKEIYDEVYTSYV